MLQRRRKRFLLPDAADRDNKENPPRKLVEQPKKIGAAYKLGLTPLYIRISHHIFNKVWG